MIQKSHKALTIYLLGAFHHVMNWGLGGAIVGGIVGLFKKSVWIEIFADNRFDFLKDF